METKKIYPHKFQQEALQTTSRFTAIISGIQGGKTFTGVVWSRLQYDQNEEDDGMICAPTYKILQQSTLPKFFEINSDLKRFYKKGDSIIEVPGRKGKIYIRSTENPNTLEGMTLGWCWADEAGQMKLDAWINIQGRLSIKKGKCFITTTPYYFNWLATDFYEQYKQNNPDYKVVQFTSVENPYFPKEEYERVKKTMDTKTFQRRYMGIFTKMEGLVYEDFQYTRHVKVVPEKYDMVIAGIDWGFTAPAAIEVIGFKDNVYWVIDEYYEDRKTTDELIEICLNLKGIHKINRFYADSAEPDRIEQFNRRGLYTLPANKDIVWGINKVRQYLKEEKLLFGTKCKFLLDEIERYHYPESKENKPNETPEKADDHAVDALRYALATVQPASQKTARPVNHFALQMLKKNKHKIGLRMA